MKNLGSGIQQRVCGLARELQITDERHAGVFLYRHFFEKTRTAGFLSGGRATTPKNGAFFEDPGDARPVHRAGYGRFFEAKNIDLRFKSRTERTQVRSSTVNF